MPKNRWLFASYVEHPCGGCLIFKEWCLGTSVEDCLHNHTHVDITWCCSAPILDCCVLRRPFKCPFCPSVLSSVITVKKERIEVVKGTNTEKTFFSWGEYLRTIRSYTEMMARMPHLKEFLIWAAKTHPHVRVEWFNLSKSLGLYQTFLRYQKDLKCLLIHKQLSMDKFHHLNLRLNVGFSISVCASELGSKELKMQLVKVLVIRFAGGNLQMISRLLKRLFAKRVLAILAE
jgi:hypothetical protein